jgi:hypothetical protein
MFYYVYYVLLYYIMLYYMCKLSCDDHVTAVQSRHHHNWMLRMKVLSLN